MACSAVLGNRGDLIERGHTPAILGDLLAQLGRRKHFNFRSPAQHPRADLADTTHADSHQAASVGEVLQLLGVMPDALADAARYSGREAQLHLDFVLGDDAPGGFQPFIDVEVGWDYILLVQQLSVLDTLD